ncbi:MAG: hypothetical protein ABSH24_34730 [Bryobacteraceae bacterium]|jgi:hypothetical protein
MTITLDLDPEIEKGLLTQARERGISLGDYLQEIVAGQARGAAAGPAEPSPKRLIDVLTATPFAGSELNIQRSRDYPRAVDL